MLCVKKKKMLITKKEKVTGRVRVGVGRALLSH